MKLKNIILGIALGLFGLSACSEETAIDELNESTTPVQIVLNSVPAITKAGTNVTVKPSEQELLINNCVLGIYDETDQKWVSTTFVESLADDKSKAYTYTVTADLKLINGHSYTVMVIGNVDAAKSTRYEACNSFAAFKDIIEGVEEYAFEPSRLLKYGKVTTKKISLTDNRIEVPLDILAARVEFVINVKQTNVEFEETYYDMGEELGLDIENNKYSPEEIVSAFTKAGVKGGIVFENWGKIPNGKPADGVLHYGNRPIYLPTGNGVKGVYVPNYKAVRVDKYIGKTIVLDEIKVENIRTQAVAVLPYKEKGMYNLKEYGEMDFNKETRKYLFYTYAKGDDTANPLKVSFSGSVIRQYVLRKTSVTADWYAFADTQDIWGTTGEDRIDLDTGWSGSSHVFFTEKQWEVDPSIEVPGEVITGSSLGSYSNSFSIKGASNMIEHGHLYNVTATIVDFTPQSTGTLEVSIQDYNTVTVPGFGFN